MFLICHGPNLRYEFVIFISVMSVVMNCSMTIRNSVVKMAINQMNVQCCKQIIFGILPHGKLGICLSM